MTARRRIKRKSSTKRRMNVAVKRKSVCKRARVIKTKKQPIKVQRRKLLKQRGDGLFSVLIPLLATVISTAVASS